MSLVRLSLDERKHRVLQAFELVIDQGIRAALDTVGLSFTQFYRVLDAFPELSASYSRLKETRVDRLVDETIEIADTEPNPFKAKVRIEARQWLASKLIPKTYGDRLDLNLQTTVDLRGALEEAKSRSRIRTIEANSAVSTIDTQSDELSIQQLQALIGDGV